MPGVDVSACVCQVSELTRFARAIRARLRVIFLAVGITAVHALPQVATALDYNAQGLALTAPLLERVSVSSSGAQGNSYAGAFQSISSDGRFVAFSSSATNLVPADTNGTFPDIFVRDRLMGITTMIRQPGGLQTQTNCGSPVITPDGRFVVFICSIGTTVNLFMHDRTTGETETLPGADFYSSGSPSADGRFVAFASEDSNLAAGETNGVKDIFVFDRQTGTLDRVSVGPSGAESNGISGYPQLSRDGRYVVFESLATNLTSLSDTNNAYDIFIYDRESRLTTLVSRAFDGTQVSGQSRFPRISADNRFITFDSYSGDIDPLDTNGRLDVFLHDRQTQLARVVSMWGLATQSNGASYDGQPSRQGAWAVFTSKATNMVPGAGAPNMENVYIRDVANAVTYLVSVSAEGQLSNSNNAHPEMTDSGHHVAFSSYSDVLVPGDTNAKPDVFLYARLPYGDVDGSDSLGAYDAALTAKFAVGLTSVLLPEQLKAADVSGDDSISAYDAALIARRAVGLLAEFPVEG